MLLKSFYIICFYSIAILAVNAQYITVIEYKTPCTEIHKAVKKGDLSKVKTLVGGGADLKKTCHQKTLLQEAALAGRKPIVAYLLSKGMNPNGKAYPGTIAAPLYLATAGGHKGIVELLPSKKAKINIEKTPLIFYAVASGDISMVDFLIKKGLKINKLDGLKRNALHVLASTNRRRGDDPAKPAKLKKMTMFIIRKGLKPNDTDRVGQTPLQGCAKLANLGRGVPAKDLEIYKKKKLAVAEALIRKGADVNHSTSRRGRVKRNTSPLEFAIFSSFDDFISLLLKNKAKTKFSSGMTALHYAVYCGRWGSTIKKLLVAGVDINAKDKKGQTALFFLIKGGPISEPHKKVLELLLANNADLNVADIKYGNTVLHKAAKGYSLYTVKKLVDKGAKLNIKNKKGQTPLDLARNKKVNAYLVSKGAKRGK